MVFSVCVHHIKQLVLLILSVVRRALCCFKRRRKSDAEVVPLATIGVIPDRQPSTPVSNENWDNWGRGNTVREQIEDYRFRQQIKQPPPSEPPPEFYFQDMEPQIKTQAKVLVKSNNENVDSSSRLNVVCDILPSDGAELETWEEANRTGWEEAENWSVSASEKIKESRRPLGVKMS